MKFYRVCHLSEMGSSGNDRAIHSGPYNAGDYYVPGMSSSHSWDEDHPSVREEFIGVFSSKEYACGFASMEQYERWFAPKWREAMHELGFVLRVFELDPEDVRVANRQSIAQISAIQAATGSAEIISLEVDAFSMA